MTKQTKDNKINAIEILREHIRTFDTIDMLCKGISFKINEINEEHNNAPEFNVPLAVVEKLTTYIVKECNNAMDAITNASQTGKYESL